MGTAPEDKPTRPDLMTPTKVDLSDYGPVALEHHLGRNRMIESAPTLGLGDKSTKLIDYRSCLHAFFGGGVNGGWGGIKKWSG